jgi:hypothetical protein
MTLRPLEKGWRAGGVAGITTVVRFLVPLVLGADEPRFTDSGSDIMAWYVHNGDRWLAGIFVLGIAYAFSSPSCLH